MRYAPRYFEGGDGSVTDDEAMSDEYDEQIDTDTVTMHGPNTYEIMLPASFFDDLAR